MDNHEKEKNEPKPYQKLLSQQRSLLKELGKKLTSSSYNVRTESRAQWDSVAEQLNALEGPKKTGVAWRRIWWMHNARKRRKNKDINKNALKETEKHKAKAENSVQITKAPDTRKSNINLSLDFLHKHSKIKDRDTMNEINEIVAQNTTVIAKECSTQAEEEIKSATLIAIASTLHDIKTNNVVSDLRMVTKHKLHLLLCADDYHERLVPASRMSITDWLLFDTVIVHEPFDVIQMSDLTKIDQPPLVDLFDLVKKYNVEALMGEQLAMAWAAITLEYNKKGRMCTPVLLQRRWYQLKLATRERFLQFQSVVMNSGGDKDIALLKTRKPTPLQTAIIARFKSLVIKPFMSWEERIKHKLVILRNEFESIALRKRNMPDISEAAIIPVPETIDLTNTAEETDSQLKPGEFETITVKETNRNIYIDENEPCKEQKIKGATRINNDPLNPLNDDNNAIIEDVEMHLPYNTISVGSRPEPVLPKITNIFGNVHIPIENLSQISEIAEQLANNTGVVANEPNETKEHINAEVAVVDRKDEPIDMSDESNQLMEVKMECEIFEEQIGQIRTENYVASEVMAGDKKNEDLTVDKKLLMTPIVKTVKLDDMGILPIGQLTHVTNKALIDVINFNSKLAKTNTDTIKNMATFVSETVNLSSALFKKPSNCTYNSEKLSKNPDFNIVLKKLNHRFFKSESNRLLLRACKPLCVDVSKAFESKLVNGKLYLNTDNDSHKRECKEKNKNDNVVPLTSVQKNICAYIDNTAPVKAHVNHLIVPKPEDSIKPQSSNNIADVAYQKFLTQNQKDNPETASFESSNSSILDINTVDALLCIIADVEKIKPTSDPISIGNMGDINVQVITETNTHKKFIAINPIPTYEPAQCCWARVKIDALKTQKRAPLHACKYKRCTCCCKDLLAVFCMNMYTKHISNKQTDKQTVSQSTQTSSKQINTPSKERKKLTQLPKTDTVKLKPETKQLNNEQNNKVNDILANILQNFNHSSQTYSKQSNASRNKSRHLTRMLPKPGPVKFITESRQLNKLENNRVNSILANIMQNIPEQSLLGHGCDVVVMKTMLQNFSEPSIDKIVYLGKNKILLTTTKIPKHFKKFLHFQRYLEKVMNLPKDVKLILQSNGQALLQCKLGAETNLNVLATFTKFVDAFNQLCSTDTSQCSKYVENEKINNVDKAPDSKKTNHESNTTYVNYSTEVNDEVNLLPIKISNVKTITEEDFAPQSESHKQPNQKHRNYFVHAMRSRLGSVLRKALTPIQLLSELKYAYSKKGLFFKLDLDDGSLMPINLRIKENITATKSKKSKSALKKTNTTIPTEKVQYKFYFEDPVTGIKHVLNNIDLPTKSNSIQNEATETRKQQQESSESVIQQQESSESVIHQQQSSESVIQQQESSESIEYQQIFSTYIKQLITDRMRPPHLQLKQV